MTPKEQAEAMAELVREIGEIQFAKKETAKEFQSRIDQKFEELRQLADEVRTGQQTITG